ncbi:hypothetical protein LCGC14_0329620 [marine sediment metagenome]|uniref:Homing endonuclease LAGLIDADG domain-containing protein n=1 Tax=marine sediment metagenome TaxID=412755 RepID=A0A0F9TMA2_9ZZZZ
MVSPTIAQIGWTAGIIDGEGCISAYGQKRLDPRGTGKVWSLRLTVGNTDMRMLARLQELWGGNIKRMAKPRNPERHRQAYQWTVNGQEVCRVLRAVRQDLVVKGEQADLAMEFGVLMRTPGRKRLEEANLQRREELSKQLKKAKVVGLGKESS